MTRFQFLAAILFFSIIPACRTSVAEGQSSQATSDVAQPVGARAAFHVTGMMKTKSGAT